MSDKIIQIYVQLQPETAMPYRLIETIFTIDGPRSRITHQCFRTLAEAQFEYGKLTANE